MQYIKGEFSFRFKSKLEVWQRSYDNRRILDTRDLLERTHYIHNNPVRSHRCDTAEAYLFSSANKAYPIDPIPAHFV
jgi:putative transposase